MRFSRVIGAVGIVAVLMVVGSFADVTWFSWNGGSDHDNPYITIKIVENKVEVYKTHSFSEPLLIKLGSFNLNVPEADYYLSCIRTFMESYSDVTNDYVRYKSLRLFIESDGTNISSVYLTWGAS